MNSKINRNDHNVLPGSDRVTRSAAKARAVSDTHVNGNERNNAEVASPANADRTNQATVSKRMKWSNEMNKFIMRTYYSITNLETNKTPYINPLHQAFITRFPEHQVLPGRVADQRRTIIRNNLLSQPILEQIKNEVRQELQSKHYPDRAETADNPTTDDSDSEDNRTHNSTPPTTESTEIAPTDLLRTAFQEELNRAISIYQDTDVTKRLRLPKINTTRKLGILIKLANDILPTHITDNIDIADVHTLIYSTAFAITRMLGIKFEAPRAKQNHDIPNWQRNIQNKIENLRREINILNQMKQQNESRKVQKKGKRIIRKYVKHNPEDHNEADILDTLKQKIKVYAARISRYKKNNKRRRNNKLFKSNQRKFYKELNNSNNSIKETPTKECIEEYWSGLWSTPKHHNEKAHWLEELNNHDIHEMESHEITTEELRKAIKRMHNWKAPGNDYIHNFWIKKLTCMHSKLAKEFTKLIQNPETMPDFLTHGIPTYYPKILTQSNHKTIGQLHVFPRCINF